MILVNGKRTDHIEIADRGLQYGDGLFETIEIRNGAPVLLTLHLDRLQAGCHRLRIPCPDAAELQSEIRAVSANCVKAVVKLIVTRGPGGRGYRLPKHAEPTRIVSLHPSPDYSDDYRRQGIAARFCATRLGINPVLAGLKHLNRLEQVMARAEWTDPGVQEGIMLDMYDNVIEGTMSNIFFAKDREIFTPALTHSGVEGIIRRAVMKLLNRNSITVREIAVGKDRLWSADEIFVCNSIIGIWPVARLEHRRFDVGPITRQCQLWLNDFINETLLNDR